MSALEEGLALPERLELFEHVDGVGVGAAAQSATRWASVGAFGAVSREWRLELYEHGREVALEFSADRDALAVIAARWMLGAVYVPAGLWGLR